MQTPRNYTINRAVNRPIEFQGLHGQYILLAGGILVGDLVFFVILYLVRISSWICVPLCLGLGAFGLAAIYRLSKTYGVHGWAKKRAARKLPACIHQRSRTTFTTLKKQS